MDSSSTSGVTMTRADSPPVGHVAQLCPERNDLLNMMDKLFPCGLDGTVDDLDTSLDMLLIIACGDQSVGKSTLLSAVTGMPFPINKPKCPPFIFKLALRRDPVASVSVKIRPGPKRSKKERQALDAFHQCTDDIDIKYTIKEAEDIIRLNSTNMLFCGDVLHIEIAGPTQPHLTFVDLPGLFPAGSNTQFEEYAKGTNPTMLDYITDITRNERYIILTVVSAEKDFVPCSAFAHSRSLDESDEGTRTLGVITKVDTLDVGSESELFYLEIAQNIHLHFELGWHVLGTRPCATATERDQIEAEVLANGVWKSLDPSYCGIKSLRTRIGDLIYDEVVNELLGLIEAAKALIKSKDKHLSQLGSPRDTTDQKRQFLYPICTAFSSVLQAAVDGFYVDPFFVSPELIRQRLHSRRLRTVIRKILSGFAVRMREEGQALIIQDNEAANTADPRRISRAQYIQEVKELMGNYHGSELPETYIVPEILSKQCAPWRGLIREHGDAVIHAIEDAVHEAIYHITDRTTAARISRIIIDPRLQELDECLRNKLDELLERHVLGHPITYNNHLMESVQNAPAVRSRGDIETHLKSFFGGLDEEGERGIVVDAGASVDSPAVERELDLDAYPYTIAIDTADAYYKIALENIIDDVSALGIERCLTKKLSGLLSTNVIYHLTDGELHSIASESKVSINQRAWITKTLTALKEGVIELRKFKKKIVSSEPLNEVT